MVLRRFMSQCLCGSAMFLFGAVLSNVYFYSVWSFGRAPYQLFPIMSNNFEAHSNKAHCMFVVSKLYGNPEEYRRDVAMRWYKEVTLASIKKASNFSNSMGVFSAAVLEASQSFRNMAKELDDGEHVIVEESFQKIDVRIDELIMAKKCSLISLMRLDGDDLVTPVAFENIRQGWEEKCATLDKSSECILHTGPYRLTELFLYPYIPNANYIACAFTDYTMTSMNAMSQGLALTFSVDLWRRYFGGTSKAIFLDQHLHVWRNLLNMTKHTGLTLRNNPVLNHGIWVITSLSSHFYHDAGKFDVVNCTLDYLSKNLGYAVSETLWTARYSIPNLTRAQWSQNKFVKSNEGPTLNSVAP